MRKATLVSVVFVLIAGTIAIATWWLHEMHQSESLRQAQRAQVESVATLRLANTMDELEAAVGPLGVVLRLQDGGWVAIRYLDSHAGTIWSSAVGLPALSVASATQSPTRKR